MKERSIFDVAKYILQKFDSLTTMKLQKLCYYVQAWSLVWDEKPMFKEDFQAWANGPVCSELFYWHKGQFVVNKNNFKEDIENEFTNEEVDTIDAVLKFYGDKSAHWLSELTHNERPWLDARDGFKEGEICDSIITKESMQKYYGSL